VLQASLRAVTTTEEAECDAWSRRHPADTEPVQALPLGTAQALALTERLRWDWLNPGDATAFTRQPAACAELQEVGVCVGLLKDD